MKLKQWDSDCLNMNVINFQTFGLIRNLNLKTFFFASPEVSTGQNHCNKTCKLQVKLSYKTL